MSQCKYTKRIITALNQNQTIRCGSYQFNLHQDHIDQGELCDVHYWQARCENSENILINAFHEALNKMPKKQAKKRASK